ncbi:protein of unknown function [Pseudomonas sp. JV551A1]|uniref:Uncharacterized protein n=1 Tax=Pseudomonas inefficax TaxID=2078786 RepID=A0AAQ1P4T7_9PSED|nr:protein of unknown function [Pseudomonas sp. JV551A1]SPO59797.1 protein of unknown function [Pseudomonas inefficax]
MSTRVWVNADGVIPESGAFYTTDRGRTEPGYHCVRQRLLQHPAKQARMLSMDDSFNKGNPIRVGAGLPAMDCAAVPILHPHADRSAPCSARIRPFPFVRAVHGAVESL